MKMISAKSRWHRAAWYGARFFAIAIPFIHFTST